MSKVFIAVVAAFLWSGQSALRADEPTGLNTIDAKVVAPAQLALDSSDGVKEKDGPVPSAALSTVRKNEAGSSTASATQASQIKESKEASTKFLSRKQFLKGQRGTFRGWAHKGAYRPGTRSVRIQPH